MTSSAPTPPSRNAGVVAGWWTAVILLPSLGILPPRIGWTGTFLYGGGLILLFVALPRFVLRIPARLYPWLLAVMGVVMGVAFLLIYPVVNVQTGYAGSDRDDALTVGSAALRDGRYPYDERTYLGKYLSPLPGALFLATPFGWLFGSGGYQNLFWLLALGGTLWYVTQSAGQTFWRLAFLLGLNPAFWHDFLTGGDLLSNSIYVCVAVVLLYQLAERGYAGRWWWVAAVGYGVALSSRSNYLLTWPLLVGALGQIHGRRVALSWSGVAVAAAVVITLPFYLYAPSRFTPLKTLGELSQFNPLLPHTSAVVLLVTALFVVWWLSQPLRPLSSLLTAIALTQAIPVLVGTALTFSGTGFFSGNFFAVFGLNCLAFAVIALPSIVPVET